jgi:hypothetical protein
VEAVGVEPVAYGFEIPKIKKTTSSAPVISFRPTMAIIWFKISSINISSSSSRLSL